MEDSERGDEDVHLRTDRLVLRRWRAADRGLFAELNADVEVMRHFPSPLTLAESDALVDRIDAAFDTLRYGLWALEMQSTGEFIGFAGLTRQTFHAHFTPAVEVGWRLARSAWGRGYATEADRAALAFGFTKVGLGEIVSMTARTNERSRAVMHRLSMTQNVADDFQHPLLPDGHPLRPHVLYRITRERWAATSNKAGPQ